MEFENTGHSNDSAFVFEGNWQDFAKIALPNLLLTIVTLGIYRFWATARERRYLWSRTRFVDEHLEWAGTGKELFFGFVLVVVLFGVPYFATSFLAQALIARGHELLGALLGFLAIFAIFYLGGVARFRALRYRLSRTRWRGIRGGSDAQGFVFGLSYMWKTMVGWLPAGLLVPWSMTSLWNERWEKMSFGPFGVESDASANDVFARFLLFYLAPFVLFGGALAFGIMGRFAMYGGAGGNGISAFLALVGLALFFYFGLGLIAVAFYAKFYRVAVGGMRWRNLHFSFEASTLDWVKLLVGDVLLVIFTFGIGLVFLSYRHWKFFMTHLEAGGEILLDELTQSETMTAKHGEGLLDAFDVGAF